MAELAGFRKRLFRWENDHKKTHKLVIPAKFAFISRFEAEDRTGHLPYEVTVGLWYMITMVLGIAGIEILGRSVEEPFRNLAAGEGRSF
jgi:hypothetical protein